MNQWCISNRLRDPAQGAAPWLNPPSNRLTHVGDNAPNSPETHVFDGSGNLIRENGARHFAWSYADQLAGFSVRPTAAAPASVEACYLYDPAGQRVKKWVRKAGKVETTVYFSGAFERHDDGATANNTLHVLDGQSRIATRRAGTAFADEGAPDIAVKYHFGDHLGSSHVVIGIDTTSANVLVNREEFYPYGETSYGGFGRKRYRFTGMERDEESGLGDHSARHYAPWAGRWLTPDPLDAIQGPNAFIYGGCNPLKHVDRDGTQFINADKYSGSLLSPAPNDEASSIQSDPQTSDQAPPAPTAEEGFWSSIVSGQKEASFWKGIIPVLGSVQNANYNFNKGNWGWGIFYAAVAVTDVFLVRAIVTGAFRVAARGVVSLKGFLPTVLREFAPSQGVGSGTSFFTKLQRLVIQDLASYNAGASPVYRVLSRHFTIGPGSSTHGHSRR